MAPAWDDLKRKLEELEGKPLEFTKQEVSLEALKNMVAAHFIRPDTLPQIQPMLATDAGIFTDEAAEQVNDAKYAIEPKFNGVRMLCFLLNGRVRFQTRGRSLHTQLFTERTDHYPQFHKPYPEEYDGTVLDGELVAYPNTPNRKSRLWCDNDLHLAMSINGGGALSGIEVQEKRGWARYIVFDILSLGGMNVEKEPLKVRRKLLKEHLSKLGLGFDLTPQWIPGKRFSVKERYDAVVKQGGEGLIIKDRESRYERRRAKTWWKFKRFEEEVGYIHSIHKMGDRGIAGMVGSVVVADKDGNKIAIVGSLSHEDRRKMVGENGQLSPEYVGKKVLIRYHVKHKETGNPHHARLVAWLDDDVHYEKEEH